MTETDQAVEEFVKAELASKYPDHAFIGEESDAAGHKVTLGQGPT